MSKSNFDPIKALGIFIFVFLFLSWIISFFFHESNSYFFDFPSWHGNPRTLIMHDAMFVCTIVCIVLTSIYLFKKRIKLTAALKQANKDRLRVMLKGSLVCWCIVGFCIYGFSTPHFWGRSDIHSKSYALINFDLTLFIMMYGAVMMFTFTYLATILTLGVIVYVNKPTRSR